MTDNDILIAEGLHKSYGHGDARVHVLRGLDLRVRAGEFVAVMGPSGCGKTTLLHVLGMMTPADSGVVRFKGVSPTGARQRNQLRRHEIGMVFQRFNLLAVLSARDNVAISLRVRGRRDDGHTAELFRSLNVEHVAGRKPSQMSIGEQQRVAVIRALAHRPGLLLADEPTGNLDSANSQELLTIFRRLAHEGQTILMITHSPEAATFADRTVHMKDGVITA
ncbi:MAG: ABC transporter ATP-binding protein [Phycisphaerae bacterium]|nr:ABC transporter ATP-binding protein [Phycisphaerae bacterium]